MADSGLEEVMKTAFGGVAKMLTGKSSPNFYFVSKNSGDEWPLKSENLRILKFLLFF